MILQELKRQGRPLCLEEMHTVGSIDRRRGKLSDAARGQWSERDRRTIHVFHMYVPESASPLLKPPNAIKSPFHQLLGVRFFR